MRFFFWNGSSLSQITDNDYNDIYPSLYETSIAWQGLKDDNYDIFYYDDSSATTQITHAGQDFYPSLHKGKVVWEGTDGNDRELFQWDGSKIIQITNNFFDDKSPSYPAILHGRVMTGIRKYIIPTLICLNRHRLF